MPITSVEDAKKVLRIVDAVEDNYDVQDVYANFDIAPGYAEPRRGIALQACQVHCHCCFLD